jgi:transcriptional regulator with XRE-family HTH domain
MDIREVLAINLRKSRQGQRLSQEELAHRARIDRTYISSIERRVYGATIDVVDRLARVLGLEAADLLRKPARAARPASAKPSAKAEESASGEGDRVGDGAAVKRPSAKPGKSRKRKARTP